MEKLKFKIIDFVIIALLLIWGLGGFWFNIRQVSAAERKYAAVFVDNQKIAELSLAPAEAYTYTFSFGEQNEHRASLEIDGGRIRMLPLEESLCPNAVCSHTGWISHDYESIVCLPNRIMVVFIETPKAEDEGIDGVTF